MADHIPHELDSEEALRERALKRDPKQWTIQKITDPDEQDRRTYRYWQKQSPGDRIIATWELTQFAYSIRRVDEDVR